MFGSSGSPPKDSNVDPDASTLGNATAGHAGETLSPSSASETLSSSPGRTSEDVLGEKRSGHSPRRSPSDATSGEKKRRSSGVGSKASHLLASAKNSLHFSANPNTTGYGRSGEPNAQTPLQKLGKQDPALSVPQGQHNNSAGESHPGPRSTFRVGVWEDRNRKCRKTMEDTHAFLYNFLHTPAPAIKRGTEAASSASSQKSSDDLAPLDDGAPLAQISSSTDILETDNGYFAIFDGHAGTFAADWCGKKLHIILEEIIRKNPNTPIPELLDMTFTTVDSQLEKLPLKNSGCTAVTAVLRWEDRIPNSHSATGSTAIAPATAAALKAQEGDKPGEAAAEQPNTASAASSSISTLGVVESTHAKLKTAASRQRVLYTANVGDARIVL